MSAAAAVISPRELVLSTLPTFPAWFTALQIHQLCSKRLSVKEINPVLYALRDEQALEFAQPDANCKPQFRCKPASAAGSAASVPVMHPAVPAPAVKTETPAVASPASSLPAVKLGCVDALEELYRDGVLLDQPVLPASSATAPLQQRCSVRLADGLEVAVHVPHSADRDAGAHALLVKLAEYSPKACELLKNTPH